MNRIQLTPPPPPITKADRLGRASADFAPAIVSPSKYLKEMNVGDPKAFWLLDYLGWWVREAQMIFFSDLQTAGRRTANWRHAYHASRNDEPISQRFMHEAGGMRIGA